MIRVLSIVFLFGISLTCFSQTDTTKVAFVSYWSIGDSYNFNISKIKQQYREGKLTTDQKQDYIANFKVIDSTATSYTITWSYENDLETYNIPEALLSKFSKYRITEIKYKTSEVGAFLEILNWKEVGDKMNSLFDEIVDLMGEKDQEKQAKIKSALLPFKNIYSSKQGVEQLVLKELQYFHLPMGLEYDITEPLYYDEELPNMFGGKPIKAKASLTFENVDFEENYCVIKQELSLDPEDTKQVLKEAFTQMKLGNKELTKLLKDAVLQIEDKNIYEYYYNPGIPKRIEAVRETTMNIKDEKAKRIDKTTIELILNN